MDIKRIVGKQLRRRVVSAVALACAAVGIGLGASAATTGGVTTAATDLGVTVTNVSSTELAAMDLYDMTTGEPIANPYAPTVSTGAVGVSPQYVYLSSTCPNDRYRVYYYMAYDTTMKKACFQGDVLGGSWYGTVDSWELVRICPGDHAGKIKVRMPYGNEYWTPMHGPEANLTKCYSWNDQGVTAPRTFFQVYLSPEY